MKKLFLSLVTIVAAWGTVLAQSPFAGGDGSEANPYQIATAAQLNEVRQYMGANFILINDIDLKASEFSTWTPIGKVASTTTNNTYTVFSGVFDGKGYTISNININYSGNYVGFFSVVSGTIKNLTVKGIVNQPTGTSVALLAGYLGQTGAPGTIENCSAIGTVTNTGAQAALLVGLAAIGNDVIKNCYVGGSVTSTGGNYCGGIAGRAINNTVKITDCYSTADVKGNNYVGGIIGYIYGSDNVSNLYATGNIEGVQYVGGIAGKLWQNSKTQGIVALNKSIKGTNDVGRIFGNIDATATASNCYGLKDMPITVGADSYSAINSPTQKDGGDVIDLDNQLTSKKDFYATTLKWDFDKNWSMPSSVGYPILKSFYIRIADGVAVVGGDITADNIALINAADAMFIDLSAVTSVSDGVTIQPMHKNALIAVTGTHDLTTTADNQYAPLAGTPNMVVQDVELYPIGQLQIIDKPTEPQWMGQRCVNQEVKSVKTNTTGYKVTRSIPANTFVTTYTIADVTMVDLPAGLTAWQPTGYVDQIISFQRVDRLTAFTPYVLYNSNATATEFSYIGTGDFSLYNWSTNNVASQTIGSASFNGCLAPMGTDGSQWILQNNIATGKATENVEFKQANGATITAFRAYFTGLSTGIAAKFNDFAKTTGINEVDIRRTINGKVYSISGAEVNAANLQKGIYIFNGKKMIIK